MTKTDQDNLTSIYIESFDNGNESRRNISHEDDLLVRELIKLNRIIDALPFKIKNSIFMSGSRDLRGEVEAFKELLQAIGQLQMVLNKVSWNYLYNPDNKDG